MRPLTIAEAASAVVGLQQEIQRSEESRYDHRLHGVLLVAQGMTCPEVGPLLGDAPRTVEYWVRRFEREGLTGLTEGERPGRPSRLSAAQIKEINRVLRARPSAAGLRANLWDGQDTLGVDREKVWNPAGSPPMPTPVPPFRVSAPEAKTNDRQSESVVAESAQKNSGS